MRQQQGRALRGALAAMPQSAGRAAPALQRLSPGVYRSPTGQLVGQSGRPLPGQQSTPAQQTPGGYGQGRPSEVVQGIAQGIGSTLGSQFAPADKMYRFPPGAYNPNAMGQAIGAATDAMGGQFNPQGMQFGNYLAQQQQQFGQNMPMDKMYRYPQGQAQQMGQAAGQFANAAMEQQPMQQQQQMQQGGYNFFNPKAY